MVLNPYFSKQLCCVLLALNFYGCSTTKKNASEGDLEIARQYISGGEYMGATSQLQTLRRKFPKDSTLISLLGTAYLGLGDIKAANSAFKQALELNDENDDARLNLSYTQIVLKDFKAAENNLDEMIKNKKYPFMERVYINYSMSLIEQKRCDLAMGKIDAALDIDPTFSIAYFNKGQCYLTGKKYGQAIEAFRKSAGFCPNCFDPNYQLARSYYLAGQKTSALQKLEQLLALKLDKVSEQKTKELAAQVRK